MSEQYHPQQYKPKHGDLVFLTYLKSGKSHTARAIRYRQNYLGIIAANKRINDPVVNLYDIDPLTVEEVHPLESQPHGPTDLEESVKLALQHSDRWITIEIPIKKVKKIITS